MTDLLLYFALAALATIVIFAGLAELTRPKKADKLETTQSSIPADDSPIRYESKKTVYMAYDKPYKPMNWGDAISDNQRKKFEIPVPPDFEETIKRRISSLMDDYLNEHGVDASEDSFTPDELWEAAAKMHREETPDEKATIDRWERDAIENAGKE